ncbi:unknown [Tropheryma whipplei str. Twist]|uniref:Ribonuclease J n=2 Tax=Tropheryma whipplei TaxID=2039 RepID=Q83FT6_TROWT|nr:unknown [Tropheryma whipplei str. Twist]CAD67296.1 conserved hypothetical protein [Tropheryma whipplei TW08/27]
MSSVLRLMPLGGLGEVGRNMTVFELDGRILLVDCGVLFPDLQQPGVDLILPDFAPIRDRLDKVEALVLTHGHEDHIGAVPYLLRLRSDIPLIGSPLTLAFVEEKCKEQRLSPNLRRVAPLDRLKVGDFDLEFVSVNHSIPDAMAVFIRTSAGNIFHTGDFKLDQWPLDSRLTDLPSFARFGAEGVDLFMCDSTNADIAGYIPYERDIGPVLDSLIAKTEGRAIVACFSSHVARVQQVLNAAAANNRQVALLGRSMIRNMSIAAQLGFLQVPDGVLIDAAIAETLPYDRVVYVCTGSQGEPLAVLSRMADGTFQIVPGPGDRVIFASSLIPGNESSVYKLMDKLYDLGAEVSHKGNAFVHVSGHCASGELLYCYNILKPKFAMPIHGERRHLVANKRVAEKSGMSSDSVILASNGTVVQLDDSGARVVDQVDIELVYVDGNNIVTDRELKDRLALSEDGFISITVVVNKDSGEIVSTPHIYTRGFAEGYEVFEDVVNEVVSELKHAIGSGVLDEHDLTRIVRRVVGSWAGRKIRRHPVIVPLVVTV